MNIKNKYWGNLAPIFLLPSFKGGNREIIYLFQLNFYSPMLNFYTLIFYSYFTFDLFTCFLYICWRADSRVGAFFHLSNIEQKFPHTFVKHHTTTFIPKIAYLFTKKNFYPFFKRGLTNASGCGIIMPETNERPKERASTMTTILTIIAVIIICFDVFMATPFGLYWTMDCLDRGKPCYGIIISFITAIPLVIILKVLNIL